MDFGGPEAIIVLLIVLVLFGGSQIPKLARNLGRAQKEFKDGIEEGSRSASSVTDIPATAAPTSGETNPVPTDDAATPAVDDPPSSKS